MREGPVPQGLLLSLWQYTATAQFGLTLFVLLGVLHACKRAIRHFNVDTAVGGTRLVSNQAGYLGHATPEGSNAFDPTFVLELP